MHTYGRTSPRLEADSDDSPLEHLRRQERLGRDREQPSKSQDTAKFCFMVATLMLAPIVSGYLLQVGWYQC